MRNQIIVPGDSNIYNSIFNSMADNSLTNKHVLPNSDEDSRQWNKILDLKSASEMKPDWYSTKTFEVFLDALDINQPPIIESKKIILKSNDNNNSREAKCKGDNSSPKEPQNETILSAEALKILSELPDLTHMSTTRSFIFPNRKR